MTDFISQPFMDCCNRSGFGAGKNGMEQAEQMMRVGMWYNQMPTRLFLMQK